MVVDDEDALAHAGMMRLRPIAHIVAGLMTSGAEGRAAPPRHVMATVERPPSLARAISVAPLDGTGPWPPDSVEESSAAHRRWDRP